MLVMPKVLPVTTSRLPDCTETSAIAGLPMMISAAGSRQPQQLGLVVFDDQVLGGLRGRHGQGRSDGDRGRGDGPAQAACLSEVGGHDAILVHEFVATWISAWKS